MQEHDKREHNLDIASTPASNAASPQNADNMHTQSGNTDRQSEIQDAENVTFEARHSNADAPTDAFHAALAAKRPLPGLVKLFLAQLYILGALLLFITVVCFLLASWAGSEAVAIGLLFGIGTAVCCSCIYCVHKRSPSAPGICSAFIILLLLGIVITSCIIIFDISDRYYGGQITLWTILLALLTSLPPLYGLLRYFRLSPAVAETFKLPERPVPANTMTLGVFRVFCATLLIGTVTILAALGCELQDGTNEADSLRAALFFIAACLPQLVFPVLALLFTTRRPGPPVNALLPELDGAGTDAVPNSFTSGGTRHERERRRLFGLLATWLAVGTVWPALTGHQLLNKINSEDNLGWLYEFFYLVSNLPVSRYLLPLLVGVFLWRFATASEERLWLYGASGPAAASIQAGRLGAILSFSFIAIQSSTSMMQHLVVRFIHDGRHEPTVQKLLMLGTPIIKGLLATLAVYALFLLLKRHRNAGAAGRSAIFFGAVSGAAVILLEAYFKLNDGQSSGLSLLHDVSQLLKLLLSCAVAFYFLLRMEHEEYAGATSPGLEKNAFMQENLELSGLEPGNSGLNATGRADMLWSAGMALQPPTGLVMFRFFCGLAIIGSLSELGWRASLTIERFNDYGYLGSEEIFLIMLSAAFYLLFPVLALFFSYGREPFRGPLLVTLYLWLLSFPVKMLAHAVQYGNMQTYGILFYGYSLQAVLWGLLGFTWYFHSLRK